MAKNHQLLSAALYVCAGLFALFGGTNYQAANQASKRPQPVPSRGRKKNPKITAHPAKKFRRQVLDARPLRMFYYYDDTRGFESLQSHRPGITVLAPQCLAVDGDGNVSGTIPPRVREAAKAARLPIMPLLFNPGFDRATVSALLHNKAARERAIRTMVNLANRDDDVGIQIDLENMAPADHRFFTLFVKQAAARLHQNGRLLTVAVTPQFSETKPPAQHRKTVTHDQWSGAYEYRALGQYADLITLMTYDHSSRNGPPGPIAGYAWVKTAVQFAVRRVPSSKLLLGIPLYGREWTAGSGASASRSLTFGAVRALIERPEIHVRWDARWRSPWFEYTDGLSQRTVWYEDSRSLNDKLLLMREYGLRGFAAWRLGDEGPDFWPLIAGSEKNQVHGSLHRKRRAAAAKRKTKIESRLDGTPVSGTGTGKRQGESR